MPFVERRPGSVHWGNFTLLAGEGDGWREQGESEKFESSLHDVESEKMCFFLEYCILRGAFLIFPIQHEYDAVSRTVLESNMLLKLKNRSTAPFIIGRPKPGIPINGP